MPASTCNVATQTSSQQLGIVLQPRLPHTVFNNDLPRIHSATLGATAYNNIFSICFYRIYNI